jgi:hypothetical protein
MSLKLQFQFAGAEFSRPSSPYRKWLRISLISLVVLLSVLGCWAYLHHLSHRLRPTVSQVAPAASAIQKGAVPQAKQPEAIPVTPILKKVATETLAAAGSYLMQAAKITPAAPVATVAPSEPLATLATAPAPVAVPIVPVAVPIVHVAPKPVAQRTYRVHTDQERLVMAGQTAFENVMDMANKYPDAYGFRANDFLSDAKLGAPMVVYAIEETDRLNYQNGQPVKPLLKPAKQWVFPVLMGNRICCMVEVKQEGREYIPGKGSKSLAMSWNKIQEKWSLEDGYHPMLVVNPEVPGYYFTVPELPQQNLTDTIEMFYLHPGTSPADVILASWR